MRVIPRGSSRTGPQGAPNSHRFLLATTPCPQETMGPRLVVAAELEMLISRRDLAEMRREKGREAGSNGVREGLVSYGTVLISSFIWPGSLEDRRGPANG
ncbi:hypothetical protein KM043_008311 [Ampulex compressa]|nr:hypothetical protein KM043_008311 [Ampulex compressa]